MPMVKQEDYHLIGIAVKQEDKKYWTLLRKPDKFGIFEAFKKLKNSFDVAHYDSDKSYYGRKWAMPKLWKRLNKGGFFINDDIEDNLAFKEFVEEKNLDFDVVEYKNKYVGIIRKT